jgi:hypothetical protein
MELGALSQACGMRLPEKAQELCAWPQPFEDRQSAGPAATHKVCADDPRRRESDSATFCCGKSEIWVQCKIETFHPMGGGNGFFARSDHSLLPGVGSRRRGIGRAQKFCPLGSQAAEKARSPTLNRGKRRKTATIDPASDVGKAAGDLGWAGERGLRTCFPPLKLRNSLKRLIPDERIQGNPNDSNPSLMDDPGPAAVHRGNPNSGALRQAPSAAARRCCKSAW